MPNLGHGIELAFRPLGSTDDFTVIGHTEGDWNIVFSRPPVAHLPHTADIRDYVPGVLTLEEVPINVAYTYGDSTHATLETYSILGTKFELRFRGPGGSSGAHEVIFNFGFLTRWERSYPNEDGLQTAVGSYRPCLSFILNGVTYS